MNEKIALELVKKIMISIFGNYEINTLDEVLKKYAFDIKLPMEVIDSTTGEITWAASVNPEKYITVTNMEKKIIRKGG